MLKLKHITIVSLLLLNLYGCTGSKAVVSFEILEPASVTYPKDVESVGYLNNSPRSLDVFRFLDVDNLNDTDLFIIDTMICNSIMRGFREGKSVYPLNYLSDITYLEARRYDTLLMYSKFSPHSVKAICRQFDLDALISFDFYKIAYYEFQSLNLSTQQLEKVYSLIPEMRWTIHLPDSLNALDVYHFKDTLYFSSRDSLTTQKYLSPIEMIRIGVTDLGYAFGMRNIPLWNEISRVVYMGMESELKQAAKYTDEGDWEAAMALWLQLIDDEKAKLAAKSAHNIAVYYELNDDLDSALKYSTIACEKWASPRIEFYKDELEVRLKNRQDIIRQVRID